MQEPTINITALVSYKIFPAKMGGQKGIALFYQYLSRLLPITMIATKNNEFPVEKNIAFLPVLGNSKFRYINPLLFFTVKKILRKNKSTHLIIEHPYYGWLGILIKWFCNVKLIVHSHNIEALRFKSTGRWWWSLLWKYEKFTYRKADIRFFISEEDRQFAIKNFSLDEANSYTITYGSEISSMPSQEEKLFARKQLEKALNIGPEDKILFFNGTLDYRPNLDAVDSILQEINPVLLAEKDFKYKIIICGKGLPTRYDELKHFAQKNIIYAGFVDDISIYFKGADIFINPVLDGGGIKTKLVEALGYNLTVVSSQSGAIGIPQAITGNKMYTIADKDWRSFAKAVLHAAVITENIPASFFDHFYWGNIAAKVVAILKQDHTG